MRRYSFTYNQGVNGWVESWWSNESGVPSEIPTTAIDIAKKGQSFRNRDCYLAWLRISSPDTPGKTFGQAGYQVIKGQAGTFGEAFGEPDTPGIGAVYTCYGADNARKSVSIRGLRDADVTWSDAYKQMVIGATTAKRIDTYLEAVKAAGWGIRHAPSGQISAPNQKYVNSITPVPGDPGHVYLRTVGDLGAQPTPTTPLAFSGSYNKRTLPYFPKIATVLGSITDEAGTKYLLTYEYPPGSPAIIPTGLRVRWATFSHQALVSWSQVKVSTRDTGRPFGSGRGRQSAATASR